MVLGVFWLVGLASTGLWVQVAGPTGWRLWAAIVVTGAATFAVALSGLREVSGTLVWDGTCWLLESVRGKGWPPGSIARVHVHVDLQGLILARLEPAVGLARRRPQWLWLERRHSPATWVALRRALVAQGGSPDHLPDGNRQESGHART